MAHDNETQMIEKTRNTARYLVENRHIAWVLLVFTMLWGAYSYVSMPKRKDPEIPVRVAAALLSWPGASAEDVEARLTRVVEKKLAENAHIERIESTTRASVAVVTMLLDANVKDTGKEFDDIWLKLSTIDKLPEGASLEFMKDFGDTAALMLTVASPRASEIDVQLRAQKVAQAITETRAGLSLEAQQKRVALVSCYPSTLADHDLEAVRSEFAQFIHARGVRDVRPFSGRGFLGLDLESDDSDEEITAQARSFVSERMRRGEIHPDIWQLALVRDPASTFAQLKAVAGEKYSHRELDRYSEQLEKALQGVPQVARVSRAGVIADVVYLEYSQEKLASYGIAPGQIQKALSAHNIPGRGGAVEVQGKTILIAPAGELRDEHELGGLVVTRSQSGAPVYLRDLVSIQRSYESPRYAAYASFRDPAGHWQRTRAVALSITMKSGLQIADFGRAVDAKIASVRPLLPEDLVISRVSDQPLQVAESVDLFMSSLYEAIALVVLVALIGFWEWRSALLMALSIPITLAFTFGLMRLLGMDIQQISIGSLIIALGLLVDDPVVAADAIKRDLERGLPGKVAAWLGPTKLAHAILFATITNIVAYLPFLTLTGDSGRFIFSLPIVLTASLVASRLVSMSFVPLLGMVLLRKGKKPEPSLEERRKSGFARAYARVVTSAVNHRKLVLAGSALALGLCSFSVRDLKQSFFPKDFNYLCYVDVWLPEDSPVAASYEKASEVEAIVREIAGPRGLKSVTTFVGGGGPRFWFSISPEQRQSNYAQLIVRLEDKRNTESVVGPLQQAVARRIAGARVDVQEIESGPSVGLPVAIRIAGEDPTTLRELASKVDALLRAQPNAERFRDSWGSDNFTLKLRVDPGQASLADVTNQDVVSASALALNGTRVGTLQEGEHQLPIVARLRNSERQRLSDVSNLYVYSSHDARIKVPLRQISELEPAAASAKILRRNHTRTITIGAFPTRGTLPSELLAQIRPGLSEIERALPPGYTLEIGGEHAEQQKSFGELQIVLLISVCAIFMALVFQFKSATKPLIVFVAIPFGIVAALMSLLVMDSAFGFMAFLGVISLIGVIVSHVIVLFDFIEERYHEGAPLLEALIDAGIQRLRPVLVTVGATVLGLVPLAKHGGPLWEPLCWVQIGGLTFATLVTLLLVPVLYAVFVHDLKLVHWNQAEPARSERPSLARLVAPAATFALLLSFVGNAQAEELPDFGLTAQTGGLLAKDVAQRAHDTSPSLDGKQAELRAARARLDKALIDYYPRLSGSFSYTRYQDVTPSSLGNLVVAPGAGQGPLAADQPLVAAPLAIDLPNNATAMVATLSVPVSDYLLRLVQSHAAADASEKAARASLLAAQRKLAYDAHAVYYSWVRAELELAVAQKNRELASEHLGRVQKLFAADSASQADVARIEASLAQSELLATQAENVATLERERCAILMHEPPGKSYAIGEDLRNLPALADVGSLEQLVQEAEAQRPELRALAYSVTARSQEASATRALAFPRLDASGQLINANPNQRYFPQEQKFRTTWQVGVQLSFSINDAFSGRAQAQAAREKASAAEAERRAMLDAVRGEVTEAHLARRTALSSIDASQRRATAAETSYRARHERFLAELATSVELTEAQNELFRARLDLVQAQVSLRLAQARLGYARGAAL